MRKPGILTFFLNKIRFQLNLKEKHSMHNTKTDEWGCSQQKKTPSTISLYQLFMSTRHKWVDNRSSNMRQMRSSLTHRTSCRGCDGAGKEGHAVGQVTDTKSLQAPHSLGLEPITTTFHSCWAFGSGTWTRAKWTILKILKGCRGLCRLREQSRSRKQPMSASQWNHSFYFKKKIF